MRKRLLIIVLIIVLIVILTVSICTHIKNNFSNDKSKINPRDFISLTNDVYLTKDDCTSESHISNKDCHYSYDLGNLFNIPIYTVLPVHNAWNRSFINNNLLYKNINKYYPGTILSEYINSISKDSLTLDRFFNQQLLRRLILNYATVNNIKQYPLVIHFRFGDEVDNAGNTNKISESIISLIKKIKAEQDLNTIKIVCGVHRNNTFLNDENNILNKTMKKYNEIVYKIQQKYRIKIIHEPNTADNDLTTMVTAKNLLIHQGTFSYLGALVSNGTVWGMNGIISSEVVKRLNEKIKINLI